LHGSPAEGLYAAKAPALKERAVDGARGTLVGLLGRRLQGASVKLGELECGYGLQPDSVALCGARGEEPHRATLIHLIDEQALLTGVLEHLGRASQTK